jgi:hypothetical protein
MVFISFLHGRVELAGESAGHWARPGQEYRAGCCSRSLPIARKMLLQVAMKDIGQVTDF